MLEQELQNLMLGGGAAGVSLGASLAFFKWVATFSASRADKREETLDQKTTAMLNRMELQIASLVTSDGKLRSRVDHLADELEKCEARHQVSDREVQRLSQLVAETYK